MRKNSNIGLSILVGVSAAATGFFAGGELGAITARCPTVKDLKDSPRKYPFLNYNSDEELKFSANEIYSSEKENRRKYGRFLASLLGIFIGGATAVTSYAFLQGRRNDCYSSLGFKPGSSKPISKEGFNLGHGYNIPNPIWRVSDFSGEPSYINDDLMDAYIEEVIFNKNRRTEKEIRDIAYRLLESDPGQAASISSSAVKIRCYLRDFGKTGEKEVKHS